jgi:DNA-binding CsgD family transcriptional regulator/PAS domain-containing protein
MSLLEGPLNDPVDNPWIAVARAYRLRRIGTVEDIGGQQAFEQTRVWNEVYRPLGLQDTLAGLLERQPEYSQVMVMARRTDQADFDAADRRALTGLLPHIARAWRVKQMLAEWKALSGTLKFVLDRLARPVLVTGPDGQIRFANRAADRLLTRGDAIDATRGRLCGARSSDTDALRRLIDGASRTGIGAGETAVDAIAIGGTDQFSPLAVVAEPLAPVHGELLGHGASPGAVLFLGESEATSRPATERLRVVYGLTEAEARLTSLIVDGYDVASAALAAGVSENTVKYHLKAVFGKVGVSRQAQLVRRVLADVGGLAEPHKMMPGSPV